MLCETVLVLDGSIDIRNYRRFDAIFVPTSMAALMSNINSVFYFIADEYSFSEWTNFGECSKVCGGGSRGRTRSCRNSTGHDVIIDKCFRKLPIGSYDLYKIVKFGSKLKEEDEELCNKHDCRKYFSSDQPL